MRPTSNGLRAIALLSLLPSLLPAPAAAWDSPTHTSVVRAAMLLSPALAQRIPAEHADQFWKELEEADLGDRICRYHRGPEASRDPFAEAQRLLAELGKPGLKPYARAQQTGRYFHYVADCAVPGPIAEGKVFSVANFWVNRDFVLFRQRTPGAASLSEMLRWADSESRWSGSTPSAYPAVFRSAVNLTVDAGLLLPQRAGAAPSGSADPGGRQSSNAAAARSAEPTPRAPGGAGGGEPPPNAAASGIAAGPAKVEDGPVVFVVNRVDNGFSGTSTDLYVVTDVHRVSGGYRASSYLAEVTTGGEGSRQPDLLSRQGVALAEATWRSGPQGVTYRALLLNNMKTCANDLRLTGPGATIPLAGTLGPAGLQLYEVPLPRGVAPEQLTLAFTTTRCESEAVSRSAIDSTRRLVYGSTGAPPRFEVGADPRPSESAQTYASALGGRRLKSSAREVFEEAPDFDLPVRLDSTVEAELVGWLELSGLRVRKDGEVWAVRGLARNVGTRPAGMVRLSLRAEPDGLEEPSTESVTLDLRSLQPGEAREMSVSLKPSSAARPARFELANVSRGEPAPPTAKRIPEVQNVLPLK